MSLGPRWHNSGEWDTDDDEEDLNPRAPPMGVKFNLIPRDQARKLGINPQTGEPLPQVKREFNPQDRILRDLEAAYDGIGGLAALTTWAGRNQTEFFKMRAQTAKTAPINITDSEVVIIHSSALPATKLDE